MEPSIEKSYSRLSLGGAEGGRQPVRAAPHAARAMFLEQKGRSVRISAQTFTIPHTTVVCMGNLRTCVE